MSKLDDIAKQLKEDQEYLAGYGLPVSPPPAFISLTPEFLARIDEIELKARSAFAYVLAIGDVLVNNNIVLRDDILRAYTRQLHEVKEFDEARSKPVSEYTFEAFLKKLEEKKYRVRNCFICQCPLWLYVRDGNLIFDSGCDCSGRSTENIFSKVQAQSIYDHDKGKDDFKKFMED